MTRKLRLALAAAALGTLALGTTEASAHGIGFGFHGGGVHIGGFHGSGFHGGWGWGGGWGPRYVGVRRVVFPVYGGCTVQRWITVDGYYAARRVCY